MGPLVGRVEEQRQLAEVVAAVRDGRTQVVFITGPAGIGKSRLAATVATEMPTYSHLLLESERDVAYGAMDRLIDEQLPETAPALLETRAKAGVPTFAIGVVNLIEGLDGPFALIIDDLHHLDPSSQEAFWHVIRRLDHVPALFVATSRTTQGSFAERIIQHVTVGRRGRHIHLGPLSADGVQALIRGTLFAPLHPRQTQKVMDATGGTPALVLELVALLRQGEGTTLESAIAELEHRHDLDDLPQVDEAMRRLGGPEAAALLTLALGGPLSQTQLDRAVQAMGHGPPDVQALRSTGLLEPTRLRIPRRSVSAAVAAQASAADLANSHRALGEVLAGVESLRHRVLATEGQPDEALTQELLTSAREAARVRDFALACRLTTWACTMDEAHLPLACLHALRARRPALLKPLELHVKELLPGLARSVLQSALDATAGAHTLPLADALPLADLDDTLLLLLGHSFVLLGRNRSAVGVVEMPASMATVRDELTKRVAAADVSPADPQDRSEAMNLAGLLGVWLAIGPRTSDGATASEALEAHAESLGALPDARMSQAATLSLASTLNQSALRNAAAQDQLDQLARIPASHPDFELAAALTRFRMEFLSGEWDAAQAAIEPSLASALDDIGSVGALHAQATAALIPLCRGDHLGVRMLDHVTSMAATRPFSTAMGAVLWGRGWAATANGEPRTAAESFDQLWASPLTGTFAGAESAVLRVRAHVALDDLPGAHAASGQLSSIDVAPGARAYLARHIDALLAMGVRDHAAAETAFAQAHSALRRRMQDDTPRGLQLLNAILIEDWARFHLDTNRGADTREVCVEELQGAVTLLVRAGAKVWSERLEALLSGLVAPRPQPQAWAPATLPPNLVGRLTSREREITQLVLQGRTNKEIAQALYLSVRTVEFHVRNSLSKLGAGSRVELRELLLRTHP